MKPSTLEQSKKGIQPQVWSQNKCVVSSLELFCYTRSWTIYSFSPRYASGPHGSTSSYLDGGGGGGSREGTPVSGQIVPNVDISRVKMEEQGKPPSSSSASNNTFTNSSQDLSSSLDQGQVKVEDEKPFSQVDLSGTFHA